MKHLLILVTYKLKSGMRDAFLKTMSESGILEEVLKEDGIVRYHYYLDESNPDIILLVEEWLNIRKSTWKHRIWQDSSLSRRNIFLKPSLRKRRFKYCYKERTASHQSDLQSFLLMKNYSSSSSIST